MRTLEDLYRLVIKEDADPKDVEEFVFRLMMRTEGVQNTIELLTKDK